MKCIHVGAVLVLISNNLLMNYIIVKLQRYGAHCIVAFSHRGTIFKHSFHSITTKKTKLIYSGVIIYRQPFQTVNLSNVVSDSGSMLNLINLSPFLL